MNLQKASKLFPSQNISYPFLSQILITALLGECRLLSWFQQGYPLFHNPEGCWGNVLRWVISRFPLRLLVLWDVQHAEASTSFLVRLVCKFVFFFNTAGPTKKTISVGTGYGCIRHTLQGNFGMWFKFWNHKMSSTSFCLSPYSVWCHIIAKIVSFGLFVWFRSCLSLAGACVKLI